MQTTKHKGSHLYTMLATSGLGSFYNIQIIKRYLFRVTNSTGLLSIDFDVSIETGIASHSPAEMIFFNHHIAQIPTFQPIFIKQLCFISLLIRHTTLKLKPQL